MGWQEKLQNNMQKLVVEYSIFAAMGCAASGKQSEKNGDCVSVMSASICVNCNTSGRKKGIVP